MLGEGGKGAFLYDQGMKAELGSQMGLLSKLKMTAAAWQPYSGVTWKIAVRVIL